METTSGYVQSPVGAYKVTADSEGVIAVELVAEAGNKIDLATTRSTEKAGSPAEVHLKHGVKWLEAYFKDPIKASKMKIPALNTERFAKKEFHRKVWEVLTEQVGPGATISYGELASMAGSPGAARAAGMAMKTNPVSIIVPCHRVVTSSGALGNYSSLNSTETKKWLLSHEKAAMH